MSDINIPLSRHVYRKVLCIVHHFFQPKLDQKEGKLCYTY